MPFAPPRVLIGCDLQPVDEVEHAARTFGAHYLDRIYTEGELGRYRDRGAGSLAARFAAKEAVLKLLGKPDGANLRSVEVVTDDDGRPEIRLHGDTAVLAREMGVGRIDISLSHAGGMAMAVAVAVAQPEPEAAAGPAAEP